MGFLRQSYCWPLGAVPAFGDPYMPGDVYDHVIRATVNVCVDVVLFDPVGRSLILARRCIKPMNDGPWVFGGRRHAGETREAAAMRHFLADTGMVLDLARLRYVGDPEYVFFNREQHPQDVPTHSLVHTYAVALEAGAVEAMNRALNVREYVAGSVRGYARAELEGPHVHPVLRDVYDVIFGQG